jgi:hypothetical protein
MVTTAITHQVRDGGDAHRYVFWLAGAAVGTARGADIREFGGTDPLRPSVCGNLIGHTKRCCWIAIRVDGIRPGLELGERVNIHHVVTGRTRGGE